MHSLDQYASPSQCIPSMTQPDTINGNTFVGREAEATELKNYWIFGLCPSFDILKETKEHNVSETGSVSVLREGCGRHLLCRVH
jgi:hypothetical protein